MENNLRERIEGMVVELEARIKNLKVEEKSLIQAQMLVSSAQIRSAINEVKSLKKQLQTILDETK